MRRRALLILVSVLVLPWRIDAVTSCNIDSPTGQSNCMSMAPQDPNAEGTPLSSFFYLLDNNAAVSATCADVGAANQYSWVDADPASTGAWTECLGTVASTNTITSATDEKLAVVYYDSAGTAVRVDVYADASKPDEGDAAVKGTIAWAAAQLTGGGVIAPQDGVFPVTTTITLPVANTTLACGAGAELKFASGANTTLLQLGTLAGQRLNINVIGCRLNGNSASAAGIGIYAVNLARSTIERVDAGFFTVNALWVTASASGAVDLQLLDNFLHDANGSVLKIDNSEGTCPTDVQIRGGAITAGASTTNTAPVVEIACANGLIFEGTHVYGGTGASHLDCVNVTHTNASAVQLRGLEVENCRQNGVVVNVSNTGSGGVISDLDVWNVGKQTDATYDAVRLTGNQYVVSGLKVKSATNANAGIIADALELVDSTSTLVNGVQFQAAATSDRACKHTAGTDSVLIGCDQTTDRSKSVTVVGSDRVIAPDASGWTIGSNGTTTISDPLAIGGALSCTSAPCVDISATTNLAVTSPVVLTGDTLSLNQNAGTDITADLEEETHATEHSLGGSDPITATNLASACTDAQVLGGTSGGTGVQCQTDDDVPEIGDFGALTFAQVGAGTNTAALVVGSGGTVSVAGTGTITMQNGTNCPAGNWARGVDGNGNAEDCHIDDTGNDTADDITDDNIDALADVTAPSPLAGQLLVRNTANTAWVNATAQGDVLLNAGTPGDFSVTGLACTGCVAVSELASQDFGAGIGGFTCDGTRCTLNTDSVAATQIATDGVDAAELKSTAIVNGDIEAQDLAGSTAVTKVLIGASTGSGFPTWTQVSPTTMDMTATYDFATTGIVQLNAGDAAAGTTRPSGGDELRILSHNTNCTSLTGIKANELCVDEDDLRPWIARPSGSTTASSADWSAFGSLHLFGDSADKGYVASLTFDSTAFDVTGSTVALGVSVTQLGPLISKGETEGGLFVFNDQANTWSTGAQTVGASASFNVRNTADGADVINCGGTDGDRCETIDPTSAQDVATKNYIDTLFAPLASPNHTGSATFTAGAVNTSIIALKSTAAGRTPIPNYAVYQASGTIVNAAVSTFDVTLPTSSNGYLVESRAVCHCTAGSGCTTQNTRSKVVFGTFVNTAGTVALRGTQTTAFDNGDGNLSTATLSGTGSVARLSITGVVNFTNTCLVTFIVQAVGS